MKNCDGFNSVRLLKMFFYEGVYIIARITGLLSFIPFKSVLLVCCIPFRHLILCRAGERYVVDSAFFRRYYDGFKLIKGMTVIDVGAHIGTFTIRAARKVGTKGLIVAIEPERDNYELLQRNIILNKASNVLALNVACSSEKKQAKLYLHGSTGSSIVFPSREYIEVRTVRLDDLMNALKLDQVNLLKINAEGAELDILKGLGERLNNVSEMIIAAHHYPREAEEIRGFLNTQKFKTAVINFRDNVLVCARK